MTEYSEDNALYARKVLDILTVANEFCLFLEKVHQYPKPEAIDYLHKISPLLYLKGSLMPDVQIPDDFITERFVTEEEWENIFQSLVNMLGKEDRYQAHFFNDAFSEEGERYSLSENYADIYQDLKDFIMLYQQRTYTAQQASVSQCHQLFQSHWGPRLLESMPQLHQLLYSEKLKPEDETESEQNLD